MNETTKKIIGKLDSLIEEGGRLKKEIRDPEDPNIQMWEMRANKLLERIGGEKLTGDFSAAGAFSFDMYATSQECLDYALRAIGARTNCLIVIKEDLELFDESDEQELKKIKHKFEVGADLGIIKGKYTQERGK